MDKFCITQKSFGLPKRNHLMFHKYLSSKRQGLQVRWLCPTNQHQTVPNRLLKKIRRYTIFPEGDLRSRATIAKATTLPYSRKMTSRLTQNLSAQAQATPH